MTPNTGSSWLESEVRAILNLYQSGKVADGLTRSRELYGRHPNLAISNYCLGHGLSVLKRATEAIHFLKQAVSLQPENADYAIRLGITLLDLGLLREANDILTRAQMLNSNLVEGQWALGVFYASVDQVGRAMTCFNEVMKAKLPVDQMDRAKMDYARLLIQSGQISASETVLRDLMSRPRMRPMALARLVDMVQPDPDSEDCKLVEAELLRTDLSPIERSMLLHALARCVSKIGDRNREVLLFQQSKRARGSSYNASAFAIMIETIMRVFKDSEAVPAISRSMGIDSFRPIFVVGLPRSGTTLAERILSNHQKVGGAGELNLIGNLVGSVAAAGGIQALAEQGKDKALNATRNIVETMEFLCPGKERVVDKMPQNFLYVGWILGIFPQARIVHCHRSPADNFLSGFRAALKQAHSYFDRPDWFCNHFKQYEKLMRLWYEKFPDRIYALDYDALVTTPRPEIEKLLDFCELNWEEKCLHPEVNSARILTASVMQARSPINSTSVGGWTKYASFLQVIANECGDGNFRNRG